MADNTKTAGGGKIVPRATGGGLFFRLTAFFRLKTLVFVILFQIYIYIFTISNIYKF
jgi:hypothetical protein